MKNSPFIVFAEDEGQKRAHLSLKSTAEVYFRQLVFSFHFLLYVQKFSNQIQRRVRS